MKLSWMYAGWVLNLMISVLNRREGDGRHETQGKVAWRAEQGWRDAPPNQRTPRTLEPPGAGGNPGSTFPLRASRKSQPCWYLDVGFLAPRTTRELFLLATRGRSFVAAAPGIQCLWEDPQVVPVAPAYIGRSSPTGPHVRQTQEAKPGCALGKRVCSSPHAVSGKFTEPVAKRLGREIKPNSCHGMSLVRTRLLLPWTQMSSLDTSVLNIHCISESPKGVVS